jgi:hypothetical protein
MIFNKLLGSGFLLKFCCLYSLAYLLWISHYILVEAPGFLDFSLPHDVSSVVLIS